MVCFLLKLMRVRQWPQVVILTAAAMLPAAATAKTVVFWEPGFPTLASQPVERQTLEHALQGLDPQFAGIEGLKANEGLAETNLLVLPYGSSVPVDAWSAIERYLHKGGNLLVLGGQPLHVPVSGTGGNFVPLRAQDAYGRELDFRHTYEVPVGRNARFVWREGFSLGQAPQVRAQHFYAVEGRLNGVGYMADPAGELVGAPVIVADRSFGPAAESRIVALDFDPEPGYWASADGVALVAAAAKYAEAGAVALSVETEFATLRPGEPPLITVHLRRAGGIAIRTGEKSEVKVTLASQQGVVDTATLPVGGAGQADIIAPFSKVLPPGFYRVTAVYTEGGAFRAVHENGFFVEVPASLTTGSLMSVHGNFLTRDGKPFFPVGTNYFSTESNGWDFSSPRNAAVWDKDFAEMQSHGVTFVRTGVWMPNARFIEENAGGGVNERFLRNLEAFLRCAQRHDIVVNFTFFAFSPGSGGPGGRENGSETLPNPYLDPEAVHREQAYVRSVVERFKSVPWVTWDLINEPSFSNPRMIFHGNVPNGDPSEVAAWHAWLRQHYEGRLDRLADAWSVPASQLADFDAISLPAAPDLSYERYGNPREVRALDYNLFAQDMFSAWVRSMVEVIRRAGSRQLIDVGQDEGGVTDRVLNQFYGGAGVSFTTNHTYWQDDALLWDSVAAKRPGVPNITGETGYQPVWSPDGSWRYDEFTGLDLTLRKWVLGFAAGSSGAVQWDWDREVDFGMKRSDGTSKVWENQMRDLGEFAKAASGAATELAQPEVAIVLPQSLQMSVENKMALTAQQNAVRALYGYARSEAYAVGEYQIELIGTPKLILLPSAFGLEEHAWQVIFDRVKAGATLLVTGPFDGDPHMHPTGRQLAAGIPYEQQPLTLRDYHSHYPWGEETVRFGGSTTTVLSYAALPDEALWVEKAIGAGKILFSALPLELNDNAEATGRAYQYALKAAGVKPVYTVSQDHPGITIAPTLYARATLYVITSESNERRIAFKDERSGHTFAGILEPGGSAILMVSAEGTVLASYHWADR